MTESLERLLGADALGDDLLRLRDVTTPARSVDAWATVELDRAEVEVADRLARGVPRIEDVGDERVLGARCRLLRYPEDLDVLLLEPSTEGRLAAALVRHGEGFVARYLLADAGAPERARRAGFRLTAEVSGPFGAERLVLDGPRHGPFLLLASLA